jgi:hypothetical protein
MNRARLRLVLIAAVFLASVGCINLSAQQKAERIGEPPTAGLSDALRQAVEGNGHRVTLNDGWTAEFWLARKIDVQDKAVTGALYPKLAASAFVGVVRLPQGMADYRGQSIPAGTYTLRYQLMPQDGNHMGVAPNPDFLLASPAADDARPEQLYVAKKMVALSAKTTGTGHPAVIALEAAGEPGTVTKQEDGSLVLTIEFPAAGPKEKIGIVIKGTATQ